MGVHSVGEVRYLQLPCFKVCVKFIARTFHSCIKSPYVK